MPTRQHLHRWCFVAYAVLLCHDVFAQIELQRCMAEMFRDERRKWDSQICSTVQYAQLCCKVRVFEQAGFCRPSRRARQLLPSHKPSQLCKAPMEQLPAQQQPQQQALSLSTHPHLLLKLLHRQWHRLQQVVMPMLPLRPWLVAQVSFANTQQSFTWCNGAAYTVHCFDCSSKVKLHLDAEPCTSTGRHASWHSCSTACLLSIAA